MVGRDHRLLAVAKTAAKLEARLAFRSLFSCKRANKK
jgi:hypothetical protein